MTPSRQPETDPGRQRFICIHGHFYQPPRENPWLEQIEVQDSASPFHDWNERICAECYAPNAHARILDPVGRVERMLNNYEWISFDVGPTLVAWLEQKAPQVLQAIQEADRRSLERCGGHGNALAQAYNHVILPLAGRRDKRLQVRWGIESFRRTFGRNPEGMWLPEAAADLETLEVLVDEGVRFTVLSPAQARRFRGSVGEPWADPANGGINPRRSYRCALPSGREISLFFYDGEVARQVAFDGLLNSGEDFRRRLLSRFEPGDPAAQLVHIATDGETFGHHHRFGEMALAYFLESLLAHGETRLTNYGEFLSLHPPGAEVEILEKSSWSCAHGVERWRADCGCRVGGEGLHQRWRAPLREALEWLKEKLDNLFAVEGRRYFADPWQAFGDYIGVLLQREEQALRAFVRDRAARDLAPQEISPALKLLEMQRHGQLMFTSCAWFFDEISGIESVQVLKLAARAMQLAEGSFSVRLEEEFLRILERAPSNDPKIGDARRLWDKEVRPAVTDLERVLAHFAISAVFRPEPAAREGLIYAKKDLDLERLEAGQIRFCVGAAEIASQVTLETVRNLYSVIHFDGLDVQFFWKPYEGEQDYRTRRQELVSIFQEGSLGNLYQVLLEQFGQSTYQLRDLFRDEQRRIIEIILSRRVEAYRDEFERFFQQDQPLLRRLGVLKYPVPEPMKMAASVATEKKIQKLVARIGEEGGVQALAALLDQSREWSFRPDAVKWERFLLQTLEKKIQHLPEARDFGAALKAAENILKAAGILRLPLNLWNVQNLYVQICREREAGFLPYREQIRSFAQCLRLNPNVLPAGLR